MKNLMILSLMVLATACGGSPEAAKSNPAMDASVTQSFNAGDYSGVCNALRNWQPTQTSIQFVDGSVTYYFSNTKITQNSYVLDTFNNYVGAGSFTAVCWYTISGGKLSSVN